MEEVMEVPEVEKWMKEGVEEFFLILTRNRKLCTSNWSCL